MLKLSDTINRKFVDSIDLDDWEIETDTGWHDATQIHKTIEYDLWKLTTINGDELLCADDHIVFDEFMNEIFVKNLIPNKTRIITRTGIQLVTVTEKLDVPAEHMYDISVDSEDHRFWSGNILSHNTTSVVGFILWYILFNSDKTVALLANKGETAREILGKVQLAYEHLPKWLQQGILEWNKGSMVLENNSRVIATATSGSAIRGYTINLLFIDEAAFVENWEEFFTSVFPTISSGKSTKVVLVSTPNGLNHFHHLWVNAENGTNGYNPIKVTWDQVPGRDEEWRKQTLATMNFDVEKFNQEYEVEFMGSSGTLIAGWKLKELIQLESKPLVEHLGMSQYQKPEEGHNYVCVADVSRGKGLDYSAFHIIDVTVMPYKQACTFRDNQLAPVNYAEVLHQFCKSYNSCPLLIEINDIGGQVADMMLYDFEYDNLLCTESAGRAGKRITGGAGKNVDKGIRTTSNVKNIGCSILKLLLEQNQLSLNDHNTVDELKVFSKKGVSYAAESGHHDDLVMCLVLFAWLSDQSYFKEYTDINTLGSLRDRSEEEMMEEMTPFGFIVGGSNATEDQERPPVIDNFLSGNW